MPAYNLTNSRGVVVAIINVGTTTGVTFPVEIQGQGISPYGTLYGDTVYHLLENFANTIEPTNPVEGQNFYRTDLQVPHFYDGAGFVPYLTQGNANAGRFNMLPAATGIDFTNPAAPLPIFTAPGDGTKWLPSYLVLVATTVTAIAGPAHFNLQIAAAEDVMEQTTVANPGLTTAHQYSIEGSTRYAVGAEQISLEITIGAPGTALVMDAFLFGFNNRT
jgi:hypothetical protein